MNLRPFQKITFAGAMVAAFTLPPALTTSSKPPVTQLRKITRAWTMQK
ncbi:hypothetical protein [Pontibacter rugosus]